MQKGCNVDAEGENPVDIQPGGPGEDEEEESGNRLGETELPPAGDEESAKGIAPGFVEATPGRQSASACVRRRGLRQRKAASSRRTPKLEKFHQVLRVMDEYLELI
jgi:hypothetical protein